MEPPCEPFVFTQHAETVLRERAIDREWALRTVGDPEWTETDPSRPGTRRRFRTIPEFAERLRVVIVETLEETRIVTLFSDRKATRP